MQRRQYNLKQGNGDGNGKDRFAIWFLILAVFSGLLIAFFTPPMCSPDENAHFLNAYAVSRGDFFPEIVDNMPARYVESRVLSFVWKYNDRFHGNLSEKYSFSEQYFDSYLVDENTAPTLYASSLNTINPMCYLPAGLFMAIGRMLGNVISPPLAGLPYNLLMYGRIGNLLFYAFIVYLALRITPCFRRVMLVLAMMPTSLFLGASVNYDAVLISTCFLFIAEVGKLLTEPPEKKITIGDIICILFCSFFLVGVKQAYAPLLLMLLAVPKKKYGSTKRMIMCIVSVFIAGIIAYLPLVIITRICSNVAADASAPYIASQIEYVKTHLLEMPKVFFNTLKGFKSFYLESFFGKLGQLDTNVIFPLEVLFYFLLLILSVVDMGTSKMWDRQWKRILPAFAVFISVVGIFGIMYLRWTPIPGIADGVGTQYISGVQGRYLIELLIPALSVFCYNRLNKLRFAHIMTSASDGLSYAWTMLCSLLTPVIVFMRFIC